MPRPSVEAERRKQILEATCAVIADTGLRSLRLSDVATVAGVSSGTIHYYFDTKKDVVNAAFEFNFSSSLERRRWILDPGRDPLGLLRDVVESYLPASEQALRAWRVWAELWAEGMRDGTLQQVNEQLYGQWRTVVCDMIRAAQEQGSAQPGDPKQLADMLIGMLDGLAVQVLLHSDNMSLPVMRETCRMFIDAFIAAEPPASGSGESPA